MNRNRQLKSKILIIVPSVLFAIFFLLSLNFFKNNTYAVDSFAMRTSVSNADASFTGEVGGDYFGWRVANNGDVNGDGYDDILIASEYSDYGSVSDRGQVYLFLGRSTGWSIDKNMANADASFLGEVSGDNAGYTISIPGDVNNDGYDDILIGSPYNDYGAASGGQAYLILGKNSGWSMRQNLSTADASFYGNVANMQIGSKSLVGLGDINNDGFDDFSLGGNSIDRAYIVFGKATGWSSRTVMSAGSDVSIKFPTSISGFPSSARGLGDINGDNIDDFALGSNYDTTNGSTGGVYIYLGKETGWTLDMNAITSASASYYSEVSTGAAVPDSIGSGDVNGDGINDILISTFRYSSSKGKTYVIFGKTSGWSMNQDLSTADASYIGENDSDISGMHIGSGDLNSDGFDDIVIAAFKSDSGNTDAGEVYIIFGKESGWATNQSLSSADASFTGYLLGQALGDSIGLGGDVNGDGTDDLVIGATSRNTGGDASQERVYVVFGISNEVIIPGLVSGTSLSSTSIRWNITDNSSNETGFKIYDASGNLKVDCTSSNITYCDETGLSANTSYSRKATAYNDSMESSFSSTVTAVTLAIDPSAPSVVGTDTLVVNPNGNPSNTEFAIYESNVNKYVQKGDGTLGDSPSWGTYAEFGGSDGILLTNLEPGSTYYFKTKARNSNDVETSYSTTSQITVPAFPTVTLSSSTNSIGENGGSATLTATLSSTYASDVVVNLAFSGTASSSDYTKSSDSITIPAGNLTGTATITSVSDGTYEGVNENIVIDIDTLTNGTEDGTQQVAIAIQEADTIPSASISLSQSSISENGGSSTLTATLSNKTTQNVTVYISLSGTAVEDTDYTISTTTISIPAGSLTGTSSIAGINTDMYEGNRTVILDINTVTNATENGVQQKTLTISDDEAYPTVSIALNRSTTAENGGSATLTATLSNKSASSVTVNIGFSGTATLDSDYSVNHSNITIPSGDLTGTLTISSIDNSLYEGDETVICDVSSVTNANENGTQRVTLTIQENDPIPTVTIALNKQSGPEKDGVAIVTATLSSASGTNVVISFSNSGTATLNTDYSLSSTNISIASGSTSGTLQISSIDDSVFEGDETVILDVSTVAGAQESGTQKVTYTISDDELYPVVTLSTDKTSISETGKAVLTLTSTVKSTKDIIAALVFSGTASSSDYKSDSSIVIKAGSLTGSTTISAVNDTTDEPDETIIAEISSVSNANKSNSAKVNISLLDDDNPPVVVAPEEEKPVDETPQSNDNQNNNPGNTDNTNNGTDTVTKTVTQEDTVVVDGKQTEVADLVYEGDDNIEFPEDVQPVTEDDGISIEAVISSDNENVKTNKTLTKSTLHLSSVSTLKISVPVSSVQNKDKNVLVDRVTVEVGDITKEAIMDEQGAHYTADVELGDIKSVGPVMAKIVTKYDNDETSVKGIYLVLEDAQATQKTQTDSYIFAGIVVLAVAVGAVGFVVIKRKSQKSRFPNSVNL